MSKLETSVEVPGYGGAVARVPNEAIFRVIDVEGCQIADLFVLAADDLTEMFSPSFTRQNIFRIVPRPGDAMYSNRNRHMLTFVDDTSPGRHDMAFAPCNRIFFERLNAGSSHPNCQDNFFAAMATIDMDCAVHPEPFNLYQNTVPGENGDYILGRTLTKPGDYVEFRAETDLIVVVTACSVDLPYDGIEAIGGKSTSLRIEVFGV